MRMSPLKRLNQGVTFVFIAFILISIGSYWIITYQNETRQYVMNSQASIASLDRMLVDLKNAETSQAAFIQTKDESLLEPFEYSLRTIPKIFTELRSYFKPGTISMQRLDSLENAVAGRINVKNKTIEYTRYGKEIPAELLERRTFFMGQSYKLIASIKNNEINYLAEKSKDLNNSSVFSSIIVILAGVLSILITIMFYILLRKDIDVRNLLEEELKHKDVIISKRIQVTQEIAQKIANGDYKARISDDKSDDLGSLTNALNEMASALELSFNNIKANEWNQSGIALLNHSLKGNKSPESVAYSSLESLVNYSNCLNGAFYVFDSGYLKLKSCYGYESYMENSYEIGEGIIGQSYIDKNPRLIQKTKSSPYRSLCTNGDIDIDYIFVLPLISDEKCIGVIELGTINEFTEMDKLLFIQSSQIIALELESSISRLRVQALLEETQAQSEELQSQHHELENLNTMLEAHAQQLQVSEEELKVQQEELLQTNQELEERSKQLEEKNDIVAFRNLEIQKKVEELSLTTKYKSEFLANMSHELRTPLNSILLLSRLMIENLDSNLSEDQLESARVIESSGISLLNLIDDILDLSKVEAGKMKLEYEKVAVKNILSRVDGMFRPITTEKGLMLNIEIDENVPDYIEVDQSRLEQILRNFLSNAIKFTSKGFVKLKAKLDDNNVKRILFEVEDSGIGIEENKLDLIFEAFQQADGSTRRKYGGTGLGLSISREIAKMFNGEISVKSEVKVGTTFILSIPTLKNETLNSLIFHETTEESEENMSPIDVRASSTDSLVSLDIPEEIPDDRSNIVKGDKVILIIEDDTAFAKSLLQYSNKNGYKAVLVVRGDLAVMAAEKYKPLAILLDLQLPIMNGWQVMERLKANPQTRHIPVHIMSSFQAKQENLSKGVIEFIKKPFALTKMGEIFEKIDNALSNSPKKVLIVEDNAKHASALSYFLGNSNIYSEVKNNVDDTIKALLSTNIDCVILNIGLPDELDFNVLEIIKSTEGLENLPVIIFTGKKMTADEELSVEQYVDSIVFKSAHSFQRILDEVGLFLHLVNENRGEFNNRRSGLGKLEEVLYGKTILIADDDVRNIFTLSKILEQYNMHVVSAIDGKDALVQLESNSNISIILMDIMMPEMDGYESIRTIRKQRKYKNLPIIAVTAKAMIGDRDKCIEAGASDYISKPVDKDQLLSLLRVWLYE